MSKSEKQHMCIRLYAELDKWELKLMKWLQLPFNGKPWATRKYLSVSVALKMGAHPLTVTSILDIEFSDTAPSSIKPKNERTACKNMDIYIISAYLSAAYFCTTQRFSSICKEER